MSFPVACSGEATEALVERYRRGWEEAQSQAKLLMSQRGADLEKLGAPRWSWAVHSVLARTKESGCGAAEVTEVM